MRVISSGTTSANYRKISTTKSRTVGQLTIGVSERFGMLLSMLSVVSWASCSIAALDPTSSSRHMCTSTASK
jgi:hypothetical protein